MDQINTVGLDIAKQIFQAHGADSCGAVVFRKKLRRHQVLSFFAGLSPCMHPDVTSCAGTQTGPG